MEEKKPKSRKLRWMEAQMNGKPWEQSRFYGYSIENLKHLHQPVTVRWTEPTWNREQWEAEQAARDEQKKARRKPASGDLWEWLRTKVDARVDPVTGDIEETEYVERPEPTNGEDE